MATPPASRTIRYHTNHYSVEDNTSCLSDYEIQTTSVDGDSSCLSDYQISYEPL